MIRPLSPLPLTELGRRCTATSSMPLLTAPGRPHGFTRVTCDLPARHRGMHEHEIRPASHVDAWAYGDANPNELESQPRETYAWSPRLVALAWWVLDRTRRNV